MDERLRHSSLQHMTSIRSGRNATAALLIQSIVRQTATLLAQIANTVDGRAPLARVTTQVFFDLAQELERMGLSRKVSADMFGLGLRTYRRKLQRAASTVGLPGHSLRQDVLAYVRAGQIVSRYDIFSHFADAEEAQLRAVLRELRESGLVFTLGKGHDTAYRAATHEELAALGNKYNHIDQEDDLGPTSESGAPILVDAGGEGTYAVAVWQGHPLEQEALDLLRQLRQMLAELRTRVDEVTEQRKHAEHSMLLGQYSAKAL